MVNEGHPPCTRLLRVQRLSGKAVRSGTWLKLSWRKPGTVGVVLERLCVSRPATYSPPTRLRAVGGFIRPRAQANGIVQRPPEPRRRRLQSRNCNPLIILDLLRISQLQSPHYIPLFEQDSMGPSRTLAGNRSVKPWGAWCRRIVWGGGAQRLRMRFQCLASGQSQTSLVGLPYCLAVS